MESHRIKCICCGWSGVIDEATAEEEFGNLACPVCGDIDLEYETEE